MNQHKVFVNIIRTLATAAILFQRLYMGQYGAGYGALDGIVIYAIWSPWFE